jgi:hypothetical protein
MAVSRKTQKDIGNFEAKLIGPFTTRQTYLVGTAAAICVMLYTFLSSIGASLVVRVVACLIVAVPFITVACITLYDMKLDVFLKEYYEYHIKSPDVRLYQIQTPIDQMTDIVMTQESDGKKMKKAKKTKKKQIEGYLYYL